MAQEFFQPLFPLMVWSVYRGTVLAQFPDDRIAARPDGVPVCVGARVARAAWLPKFWARVKPSRDPVGSQTARYQYCDQASVVAIAGNIA